MEAYLRFGLLCIAGVILILILLESLLRRRRFRIAEMTALNQCHPVSAIANDTQDENTPLHDKEPTLSKPIRVEPTTPPNYLMISIFAKTNNSAFSSYELFQAIAAAGLQFGEMNIFHYYHRMNHGHEILFSLASATKPGEFDLDRMGEITCHGLTLFMDIDSASKPSFAFEKMLATAEQLADDLDGELRASPLKLWNQDILDEYRQRISTRHKVSS